MSALLDIRDLRIRHKDGSNVLRGVSMTAAAREVHGLVGESGAGRTTVTRAILGVLPDDMRIVGGQIRFDDSDLLDMHTSPRRRLLGRQIATIPRDPLMALTPSRRIGRQVADVFRENLKFGRSESRRAALQLLEEVGVREPEHAVERYPYELSAVARQRVLIAIAFACSPKLVIADEPTAALDVTAQMQILRLIADMTESRRSTLLFVTHDLSVVARMCDRVTVMHEGMVVEQGPVSQMLSKDAQPFTRALMASMPRHDRPGEMLEPVPEPVRAELLARVADYDRRHR
ncbi:MAG: hypothetical protein TEF_16800 [Rhizobiales bacterium NRL2]|jgi:peptide/nickel transport system ATP-binding protein|nr:MAG: hypothetical protein TEF_16800 [Rhizobiales bacterium NRL2]